MSEIKTLNHCFRLPADLSDEIRKFAEKDGETTVASWAARLVRQRAQDIAQALVNGGYTQIDGRLILAEEDLVRPDANECRLRNAERLIRGVKPRASELQNAVGWLSMVSKTGSEEQREKAGVLVAALPESYRKTYRELIAS